VFEISKAEAAWLVMTILVSPMSHADDIFPPLVLVGYGHPFGELALSQATGGCKSSAGPSDRLMTSH
jgi:hypothetical protein